MTIPKGFKLHQLLPLCGMLVVIGLLGYFILHEQAWIVSRISRLSLIDLAGLYIVWLMLTTINGLVRRTMVASMGKRMNFSDWFGLTYVSNLLNLVLPLRGDLFFTAYFLKRRYEIHPSRVASMAYGNFVLMAMINGLAGVVSITAIYLIKGGGNLAISLVLILLTLGALALLFLPDLVYRLPLKKEGFLMRNLTAAAEGWVYFRSRPLVMWTVCLLILINLLLNSYWVFFAFGCLDITLNWYTALLMAATVQLSFLINLLPGNLGVTEGAIGLIALATGQGFVNGVAVALLQRAVAISGYLVLGPTFAAVMMRDFDGGLLKKATISSDPTFKSTAHDE